MTEIAPYVLIAVAAFISGSLCYVLGYSHANNIRDALSEELRQTKAKLAALTDRDPKGRFVRREQ